jgi:putative N6-adenine-specific DNA methylase
MIDAVQRRDVYRINLCSRVANKVFVVLAEQKIIDFDGLFDLTASLDWKQYIGSGYGVRVLAHSRESKLASTRTIQSIVHKSILTQLTGSRDLQWEVDDNKAVIEVSVDIHKDLATVMLNTSGASLHER